MGLLLTKSKGWRYEKEWRAFHGQGNHLLSYDRASLTGIYFGAKMPEDQMQMIASLLHGTDTQLYRMKLSKSRFQLECERGSFLPNDYPKVAVK